MASRSGFPRVRHKGGCPLRFLIADDHVMVRRGLVELLAEGYPRCQFVEAASVPDAIDCIGQNELDLVVLDISMPGGTGLDVLAAAATIRPELPILVVSMHSEDVYGLPALKAGASGYLTKETAPRELVAAAGALLNGGRYFSAYLSAAGASIPGGLGEGSKRRADAGPCLQPQRQGSAGARI